MAKKNVDTLRAKPVFMDGLTTYKTYLVLATNPANAVFNCVCIRRFNDNEFKMKFYPSAEAWGFSASGLQDRGLTSHVSRHRTDGCGGTHTYDRFMASPRQIHGILNTLREDMNFKVVPETALVNVLGAWEQAKEDCIYVQEEVAA